MEIRHMANINRPLKENSGDISLTSVPLRPLYQILLLWTLIIVGFAAWAIYQTYQDEMNTALTAVRDSYKKDLVYRKWAAMHGGVYVPITEQTPPNPDLSNIRDRDIKTPSGKQLTLMNPAYMTRQVHEMGKELYGLRGHITSLNPIRPKNAPDDWEIKALKEFEKGVFEKGATELTSKELIDGKPYIRFMHALLVDEGCLKCHANQGYKKEDVRGGISVSVPWEPFRERIFGVLQMVAITYGFIWVAGFFAIVIGRRRLLRYLDERNRAVKEVMHYDKLLRRTGYMALVGGWELDISDMQLFWSEQVFHIHEIEPGTTVTADEAIGYYAPEARPRIQSAVQSAIESGIPFDLELPMITAKGSSIWVRSQGEAEYIDGNIVKIVGAIQDITERKRAENERETALAGIKKLEGIIPICMYCKKIRDDKESWNNIERYITEHSEAEFSHGICPVCLEKNFPEDKK